ncbi:sensor histidine kinase [Sphingomonas sp. MMS24-JH45]
MREAMLHDVAEMEAMIASLLAFLGGASDPEQPSRVDLAVLCATLADDAEDRGRDAVYEGPDHCDWRVRRSGFKRALVNLVENALHYGERVRIVLEPGEGRIAIRIEDDGPGIPEDRQRGRALRPARSRAQPRHGGVRAGLAIVKEAVEAEAGDLRLSNRPGGGLSAEIVLMETK